ncbi:MAG: tRNA guanosine(34) transglycosylase Tgt [Candidatus Staskawiczbacteria bacterium]|nr:tRNA guanosine(34) transglycosylase Tgt [Candidatus Staskawiczbacteria bacterium]
MGISFKILKKSKKSRARLGFLETEHGVVETPCLVPVATQAVIKTLDSKEVEETKSQILISNTFWLHLRPRLRQGFGGQGGERVIEKAGGLHKFMNWKKPLMTDSAGFQVFSLGFGKDFGLTKFIGGKDEGKKEIVKNQKSRAVKITKDGVFFKSPINGDELFIGPKESIKIQEKLGADIIFAFDECTPPLANKEYIKDSIKKTHEWARICLKEKKSKQALFGIVQGSEFKDLRIESAKFIGGLDFDGFGIGGDLWRERSGTKKILRYVIPNLNEKKPRHLLGVGHLKNIEDIIKEGIDLFDCTVPTHYARHGIAFTSEGRLDMRKAKFSNKNEPLDKNCTCNVCMNYKKDYICHLLRAKEITALKLITFHNLCYFNDFVENIRQKIKRAEI